MSGYNHEQPVEKVGFGTRDTQALWAKWQNTKESHPNIGAGATVAGLTPSQQNSIFT